MLSESTTSYKKYSISQLKGFLQKLIFSSYSLYIFFGALTTLINLLIFLFLFRTLRIPAWVANIIAWWPSVIFAWWTNRRWVFNAPPNLPRLQLLGELITFSTSRICTGLIDVFLIGLTVDLLCWNDVAMKISIGILVVILNYLASKFFVFKRNSLKKQ